MRSFALRKLSNLRLVVPHTSHLCCNDLHRALATRSAIPHLVSGSSNTSWFYVDDEIRPQPRPQLELSNTTLLSLVEHAKYGAADRLRLQLLEEGSKIYPHPLYEKAAVAALQWDNLDSCVAQFSTWFSLVPDIDEPYSTNSLSPFREVRNALLRSGSPATKLPVVACFGVICASKGYANTVFREVLNVIIRFAAPASGAKFLLDIETAATLYDRRRHPERACATSKQYRSSAIEICCQVGWIDEAIQILKMQRNFALPDRTFVLLMDNLRGLKDIKNLRAVEHLRSRNDPQQKNDGCLDRVLGPPCYVPISTLSNTNPPVRPKAISSHYVPPTHNNRQEGRPPVSVSPSRATLALQLREFSRSLSVGRMPDHIIAGPFLNHYRQVGGSSRTLSILRNKALINGGKCAHSWFVAELKHHDWEWEYYQVVSIFTAYFTTSTLSGAFVDSLSRLTADKQLEKSNISQAKLRLGNHDSWIILKAIIKLSVSLSSPLAAIRTLYKSYLSSPSFRGSGRVFASFIWAFGECASTEDAVLVLDGMRAVGKAPDRRHYDMLAAIYARAGNVNSAMGILEMIEHGKDPELGLQTTARGGQLKSITPRLVTYGRVIQGFLDGGLLEAALAVEQRMKNRLPYRPGLNRKLDNVIASLENKRMAKMGC